MNVLKMISVTWECRECGRRQKGTLPPYRNAPDEDHICDFRRVLTNFERFLVAMSLAGAIIAPYSISKNSVIGFLIGVLMMISGVTAIFLIESDVS